MKRLFYLSIIILLSLTNLYAENIDPDSDNSQYSYSETTGWFNFEATNGGATVTASNVTGWIWCENLGWLRLHHNYGWITNAGTGNLSGYAYSETSGWINFNPVNGGVHIDPQTGDFQGWAWGENIGWIHFKETSPVVFKVKTSWGNNPPSTPTNLTATAISSNQIDIIWNDVANETSYTLFRNESNNTNSALPIIGFTNNQTNHSDASLSPGTTYYYWVKTYNISGSSGFSSVVSNSTLPGFQQFTMIQEPMGANLGTYNSGMALGDIDNDGDLDIGFNGYDTQSNYRFIIFQNNNGLYTNVQEPMGVNLGLIGHLAFGDIDNDGDLDMAVSGSDGINERFIIFRNNIGVFTQVQEPMGVNLGSDGSLIFGDIDNDGDLDIGLTGRDNALNWRFIIFKNNGNGIFTNTQEPMGINQGVGGTIAFGDIDNDADLDIALTGYHDLRRFIIFKNDGNGFFTNAQEPMGDNIGLYWSKQAFGDIDNDGDLDIAMAGNKGPTAFDGRFLIFQNDSGIFNQIQEPMGVNIGTRGGAVAFGDYDNDGDLDIVLTGADNPENRQRFIIFQNNNGNFTKIDEPMGTNQGVYGHAIALGDIDNDGDLDIALPGEDKNAIKRFMIFQNNELSPNPPPSIRPGMSSTNIGGYWKLSWNQSSDDHTITDVLRYQIAIGTNAGIYNYASTNIHFPQGQANIGRVTVVTGSTIYYQTKISTTNSVYWKVCAIDTSFKNSPYCTEQLATMNVTNPTGLTANMISTNQIQLTWSDVSTETSYTLFRNAVNNSVTAAICAGLPANATSYIDTIPSSSATYYYWLKAYNQYGSSEFSAPATIQITNATPTPPTGTFTPLSNIVYTNLKVSFDWSDASDLNDSTANLSYVLRIDDDEEIANSYDFQVTSTTGTSAYTDLELTDNNYYTWAVKTIDDEGAESAWSELQNFFLISKRLEQPKWEDVEIDGLAIKLKWKKSNEPHLEGYNVYWGMQKGIYTNQIDVKTENEYTMQDMKYDYPYFISLAGYDIAGRESEKAEEQEVTIKDWVKGEKSILYNSIVKPDEDMEMELMIKMEQDDDVEIRIYSRSGRPIIRWKEHYKKGIRVKTWDLKDKGKTLSSGVYYVVIQTSKWKKTILLCVIK